MKIYEFCEFQRANEKYLYEAIPNKYNININETFQIKVPKGLCGGKIINFN